MASVSTSMSLSEVCAVWIRFANRESQRRWKQLVGQWYSADLHPKSRTVSHDRWIYLNISACTRIYRLHDASSRQVAIDGRCGKGRWCSNVNSNYRNVYADTICARRGLCTDALGSSSSSSSSTLQSQWFARIRVNWRLRVSICKGTRGLARSQASRRGFIYGRTRVKIYIQSGIQSVFSISRWNLCLGNLG